MSKLKLPEFHNEPYTDFAQPENRQRMEAAQAKVRGELGREYKLVIAGKPVTGGATFKSTNPARPAEIVGVHQKATTEQAVQAIEAAWEYFPQWSRTKAEDRVAMLLKAAAIIRERKLEFDAWLVFEAGKTWPEAEAEVAEAVDFCEYYAREMARLAGPQPVVQLHGERDEMHYLPLGVGIVIPPWNFSLAILAGMATAALVAGNVVVIKPSSETPTIAAKFVEVLEEAGFPAGSFSFLTGSGAAIGDALVQHPKTWGCISMNWRPDISRDSSGLSVSSRRWAARTRSLSTLVAILIRRRRALSSRHSATRGRSVRPVRGPSSTARFTTNFWVRCRSGRRS
jgi:1-pyrroline-5-carboxylate dehydrogenase